MQIYENVTYEKENVMLSIVKYNFDSFQKRITKFKVQRRTCPDAKSKYKRLYAKD